MNSRTKYSKQFFLSIYVDSVNKEGNINRFSEINKHELNMSALQCCLLAIGTFWNTFVVNNRWMLTEQICVSANIDDESNRWLPILGMGCRQQVLVKWQKARPTIFPKGMSYNFPKRHVPQFSQKARPTIFPKGKSHNFPKRHVPQFFQKARPTIFPKGTSHNFPKRHVPL